MQEHVNVLSFTAHVPLLRHSMFEHGVSVEFFLNHKMKYNTPSISPQTHRSLQLKYTTHFNSNTACILEQTQHAFQLRHTVNFNSRYGFQFKYTLTQTTHFTEFKYIEFEILYVTLVLYCPFGLIFHSECFLLFVLIHTYFVSK